MLKRIIFFCCALFLFMACNQQRPEQKGVTYNENIEWSHTWIVKTNDTIRPKVLMIGDSHVERYYGVVANSLGDGFSCSKFTTSKSLGDPIFVEQLKLLLMQYDFDYITINNGLHGEKYTTAAYSSYLPFVHDLLKKNAKQQVIWVNTTAMRKRNDLDYFAPRNEQVIARNKALAQFTKDNNIPIIDFYAATADSIQFYSNDGVHFNKKGVDREAEMIVEGIEGL